MTKNVFKCCVCQMFSHLQSPTSSRFFWLESKLCLMTTIILINCVQTKVKVIELRISTFFCFQQFFSNTTPYKKGEKQQKCFIDDLVLLV